MSGTAGTVNVPLAWGFSFVGWVLVAGFVCAGFGGLVAGFAGFCAGGGLVCGVVGVRVGGLCRAWQPADTSSGSVVWIALDSLRKPVYLCGSGSIPSSCSRRMACCQLSLLPLWLLAFGVVVSVSMRSDIPSEAERLESWLRFCLHVSYVDNDILQVGRNEDHRAVLAEREYGRGKMPGWLQGRSTWRDLRESAGLSRDELAKQADCDRASISRYESGARFPESNSGYVRWLKEAYAKYLAVNGEDILHALLERDGWMVEDPDSERSLKWNPDLPYPTDDEFDLIKARLDEHVVVPWVEAGMPEGNDVVLGHYTPQDHGRAA